MGDQVLERAILRKRPIKKLILIGVEGSLVIFSYILAIIFRYYMEGNLLSEMIGIALKFKGELLLAVLVLLACQWSMKQYQSI